jgi:hypothetical protein
MKQMWDFLKHIKELLSLDYRSVFIVACVCWVIVLIPPNIWQDVGWFGVWSQFKAWIFIIALLFTIWFVSSGLYDLSSSSFQKWSKRNNMRAQILYASRVEKEILARYLAEDTTTIAFEVRDGIVNGLISKGILYRASNLSNPMSYDFDTNIQPWAWEYLKKHPEVLKDIDPQQQGRHQWRFW